MDMMRDSRGEKTATTARHSSERRGDKSKAVDPGGRHGEKVATPAGGVNAGAQAGGGRPRRCERAALARSGARPHIATVHRQKELPMKRLGLILVLLSLAACSASGDNKQIPVINGVPVTGMGMGGPGITK